MGDPWIELQLEAQVLVPSGCGWCLLLQMYVRYTRSVCPFAIPARALDVQGYFAQKTPPPVGPYSSPMPRNLW